MATSRRVLRDGKEALKGELAEAEFGRLGVDHSKRSGRGGSDPPDASCTLESSRVKELNLGNLGLGAEVGGGHCHLLVVHKRNKTIYSFHIIKEY